MVYEYFEHITKIKYIILFKHPCDSISIKCLPMKGHHHHKHQCMITAPERDTHHCALSCMHAAEMT